MGICEYLQSLIEDKQDVMALLLYTGVVEAAVQPIVLQDVSLSELFAWSFLSLLKAVADDMDMMRRVLDILQPFTPKLAEHNVKWNNSVIQELVARVQ